MVLSRDLNLTAVLILAVQGSLEIYLQMFGLLTSGASLSYDPTLRVCQQDTAVSAGQTTATTTSAQPQTPPTLQPGAV